MLDRPSRPPAHVREDLSRTRVRRAFESAGWTVEDISRDYGEDQLIRIVDAGEPTGLWFFVQVKSAASLSRYTSANGAVVSYPFAVKNLQRWARTAVPVLLVLWDAETDRLMWRALGNGMAAEPGAKTKRLHFRAEDVLEPSALERVWTFVDDAARAGDRHSAGAETLAALLSEATSSRVEYNPNGIIVRDRGGSADVYLFGEMLPVLDELERITGLSSSDAFLDTMRWAQDHPDVMDFALQHRRRLRQHFEAAEQRKSPAEGRSFE